ncbi:MAG: fatty acid desaturase [Acidimicrobiales bacterium]
MAPVLPRLADLGADLLHVSRCQQAVVLLRPVVLIGAYAAAARAGWWHLALVLLVAVFPAMVAAIHDLLHRSLGLGPRANRWWLSVLGILVLQSGHAIQATHAAHHRRFPAADDPEAYVSRMSIPRAILEGPVYPVRLWAWARCQPTSPRRRILGETAGHVVLGVGCLVAIPISPIPFVYAAAMCLACSLFPAVSVNLLHREGAPDELAGTRTVHGVVLPLVTLGSGYHLEHHLYPRVPSPHYGRLARRLRPVLQPALQAALQATMRPPATTIGRPAAPGGTGPAGPRPRRRAGATTRSGGDAASLTGSVPASPARMMAAGRRQRAGQPPQRAERPGPMPT